MCGFSGSVDSARLKVDGDVRAISLNELKAVWDRKRPVAIAMVVRFKTSVMLVWQNVE